MARSPRREDHAEARRPHQVEEPDGEALGHDVKLTGAKCCDGEGKSAWRERHGRAAVWKTVVVEENHKKQNKLISSANGRAMQQNETEEEERRDDDGHGIGQNSGQPKWCFGSISTSDGNFLSGVFLMHNFQMADIFCKFTPYR